MHALVALLQDSGLTFREVAANIPHDGPAVVIYAMLVACVWLIWRGSRTRMS